MVEVYATAATPRGARIGGAQQAEELQDTAWHLFRGARYAPANEVGTALAGNGPVRKDLPA